MADAEFEARLVRLEQVRAIESLKARYLRACDRKQPEAVRACFADDAVIDFEGFPLFTDPDAFVAIYTEWGCRPTIVDMHHLQNPIVELTGADSAKGWFDLFFFQIDTETRRLTQLAVSYDDDFVLVEGSWKIARTVSRRLSMLVQEMDDDGIARIRVAARSDADEPTPPPR